MNKNAANALLELPLKNLMTRANKVRSDLIGSNLELCNILNAKSGLCSEDCKFCAQSSKHNADVSQYPLMNKKEILQAADYAKSIGAEKFGIVTSGNRLNRREISIITEAISEIKDITVCASLGALSGQDIKLLRNAGLTRYHHNIETSPDFYSRIVSSHNFQERINTIKAAKRAGLEVCSGGIIGMGEDWQDRINMALLLKELEVDAVPINFLVPIKGTSFESLKPISYEDAIRTICIFRIILEDKVIKIAAGRETILKKDQSSGFMAGANGMLIGGYLTVKGDELSNDYALIERINKLWSK